MKTRSRQPNLIGYNKYLKYILTRKSKLIPNDIIGV